MTGTVLKSTGSWYNVQTETGAIIQCRIKGKFRLEGIKHTNPIAVGDKVEIAIENEQETAVITQIHERKNYIIRKSSNLSKQTHIIASNLDQAIIVASLIQPATSLGFIDRFLATAEAYHIPAIIVFNKTDLYNEPLKEILNATVELYTKIGYRVISTSTITGENINTLTELLQHKVSLFSGHSGVGKSTLLNLIEPSLQLKTGSISNYSNKGKHTTTFAEMLKLSFGGYIIDTPGIKELGVVDFDNAIVSHYFKEMKALIGTCRFNDCIHVNEPGCSVLGALNEGKISAERYASYLSIIHNEDIYN